jgi:hypothetical protein
VQGNLIVDILKHIIDKILEHENKSPAFFASDQASSFESADGNPIAAADFRFDLPK